MTQPTIPKRFATLDDVAKAAGLSRAQISRALSGKPGVLPQTLQHIQAVAAELDYKPNLAARSLVSARSSIVGLVIGDPNNPFHIQLAQAVDQHLSAAGFDPVVSLRAVEQASALHESDRLLKLRAAGVIMLATPHTSKAIGEIAAKLPCVYIGSKHIDHPRVTTIAVDDEAGVRMAIAHLISLGHRQIAHLGGGSEASARQRTQVYCRCMREAGLKPRFFRGSHDAASGRRGVDLLFADGSPPTAIFASNDFIALGVIDRLKGMGLAVPQDVSVIGFDNIPAAASEIFSLSTLRQDTDQQARTAVASLKMLINNPSNAVGRQVMPVELILRRSSAVPSFKSD
ncbi:LacI family DNA-binding transcriptional regulator [Pseudomonas sp. GL-RE-29]|uniref:LacI family DNA-binding transcriptional regulator n=1 Tax=Pseudomonas TaxID=286 RepID=UPI001CBF896D|nr:LacI family DNA-binding transcriptional regulator [Pseudomonas sp. GL-RE-29]